MLVLSWNSRGLGRPAAKRSLRTLVRKHSPSCIFLSETKMKSEKLEALMSGLGCQKCFLHPPRGKSGGLCLALMSNLDVEITHISENYINCLVYSSPPVTPWMLTCVYGPPRSSSSKAQFWSEITQLGHSFSGPWICMGDFNHIISQSEKSGGRAYGSSSSSGMQQFINEFGLIDLGFEGNRFTWSNKREDGQNIKERLDRGIANIEWRTLFHRASITHLPAVSSDHNPLLLDTFGRSNKKPRQFKFEEMWTRDPSCFLTVQESWKAEVNGSSMFRLSTKLKVTKRALRKWNRQSFGHIKTKQQSLLEEIDTLQQQSPTTENLSKEAELELEYQEWLKREEIMWRQKSRDIWLTSSDLNTRFFHLSTIIHRRHNTIEFLKTPEQQWISDSDQISFAFLEHFETLYTTTNPPSSPQIQSLFPTTITPADNELLCAIPDRLEIQQAVFSLGALKAPGPDGLPALFYHKYWQLVGEDVVRAIQSFFREPRRNCQNQKLRKGNPRLHGTVPSDGQWTRPFSSSNFAEPTMAAVGASLNHISRESSDIRRLAQFYKEILGFEEIETPDFGFKVIWLSLPSAGVAIHLIERLPESRLPEGPYSATSPTTRDPKYLPRGHHLCFSVSNFDSFVQTLKEKGIETFQRALPNGKVRQIFFFDPDGNGLEVASREES